eukprot:GHVU01102400.1.p1 GENE.GHVU01102400.1~~GHVU01102400.1.p1  ORF type:complete len:109 (-),score=7.99 GHVU01102400.1:170-496(-)
MTFVIKDLLSLPPQLSLFVGVVLTVIGSVLMALGNALMKLGIQRESKRLSIMVTYPLYSSFWWSGFVCFCVGAVLHIAALAFAPASILAPLNALGLVANAALAAVRSP